MRLPAIIAFGLLVSGCVVTTSEIVRTHPDAVGRAPAARGTPGAEHIVARGETLYAIAFRRGVDWRDLARWNRLAAPYTIYPGQRLQLGSTSTPAVANVPVPARGTAPPPRGTVETRPLGEAGSPSPPPRVQPVDPTPPIAGRDPVPAAPVPGPAPTPPGEPITGVPATIPPPLSPPPAPMPRDENAPTTTVGGIRWRWPTQGEVIQRYTGSDLTRQGIDIAGRSGQAVVTAADGEVVYSGSGLRGYGELIIIKHSGDFLSAYGHNRKRLVVEGQRVQAGEPIAELGRTGTDRDKLHFEIRRSGKPVDPMQFLPRR